jgi:hypothetical protein
MTFEIYEAPRMVEENARASAAGSFCGSDVPAWPETCIGSHDREGRRGIPDTTLKVLACQHEQCFGRSST